MGQSLVKVYVHFTFSTKCRQPLIDPSVEKELYAYLGGACNHLDCQTIIVNGHIDHVHILCMLSKKITIVKLMEDVKSQSSKWIKTKGDQYRNFYWQDGYGAFSVNYRGVDSVAHYIARQKEHHQHIGFKEECRILFKENGLDLNENYFWD